MVVCVIVIAGLIAGLLALLRWDRGSGRQRRGRSSGGAGTVGESFYLGNSGSSGDGGCDSGGGGGDSGGGGGGCD